MGGYAVSGGYPFTSRGQHPYIRSFALNGPLAVMIGWPFADESFPMTLDSLRRVCRRFNVFHKYYRSEDDVDNDFYMVLGQIEREAFPEEKLEFVQGHLRQLLSEQVPVDLVIWPEDLSVVCYVDTQLPIASSSQYSLAEALVRVEELKLCYRESITVKR
jgi:hypothetical protein